MVTAASQSGGPADRNNSFILARRPGPYTRGMRLRVTNRLRIGLTLALCLVTVVLAGCSGNRAERPSLPDRIATDAR